MLWHKPCDVENVPHAKVCLIGAGCSGITTAKRLKDFGVPYDHFEMSDDVGGNWYYDNPNGLSACYQSLHIDTSKSRLEFEDFPVPTDWPDFPHHSQLHDYFRDYVDHFGLRENIKFEHRGRARRTPDRRWLGRHPSTGETRSYTELVVANGHHWDPRFPDYPGEFDGALFHSHAYRDPFDPVDMRGKTVVVVGMGNSGIDIASELAQRRMTKKLYVSARRGCLGAPEVPRRHARRQDDDAAGHPEGVGLKLAREKIRATVGQMSDYGLPEPDHEPLAAHPR